MKGSLVLTYLLNNEIINMNVTDAERNVTDANRNSNWMLPMPSPILFPL
jgi:hypothetical protein